jgi:hypothetical protein
MKQSRSKVTLTQCITNSPANVSYNGVPLSVPTVVAVPSRQAYRTRAKLTVELVNGGHKLLTVLPIASVEQVALHWSLRDKVEQQDACLREL